MFQNLSPAEYVATALRDAATCYRGRAEGPAAEHVRRAQDGMNRHGVSVELAGQTQVLGSFAFLGLFDRAAEVAENIADATEVLAS